MQIRDRLSFRGFLGLNFLDIVPDAKTMWPLKFNTVENNSNNSA
jgi:hypothetical protein